MYSYDQRTDTHEIHRMSCGTIYNMHILKVHKIVQGLGKNTTLHECPAGKRVKIIWNFNILELLNS